MTVPFSVLDLVPLAGNATSGQAMRNSIALAKRADALGYVRHWFAEHHNMPTIASTTPELMIALAAEATTRIELGSGGVMLPNHRPLKVAESYKMLEALYPGRINLGIGRAPGTDGATARALRGAHASLDAEDFPMRLGELMAFGRNSFPPEHPYAKIQAVPLDVQLPPIWLLGSSGYSAKLAALMGVGFGFAAHFSDYPAEGPMLDYRRQFQPQGTLEKPHAILTLSIICADTDEEAEYLASSLMVAFTRLRTGQKSILLDPEEASAYPFTAMERAVADSMRAQHLFGSPATIARKVQDLVTRTQADEVMVTTFTFSHEARVRSYELVAETFGLTPA